MATFQPSIESLSTADGNESSWLDLLPGRKLFSHLREQGSGSNANISGNIMCTVCENLFVWSREENALLTVNLKRLCAAPDDDNFQVCQNSCMLGQLYDKLQKVATPNKASLGLWASPQYCKLHRISELANQSVRNYSGTSKYGHPEIRTSILYTLF